MASDGVDTQHFGTPLYAAVSVYMVFLFGVGIYFWRRNRNAVASVEEHYVARGAFGPLTTTMTVLATSFSGFTVVGVPADAWANGFLSLRWIGQLQALVCGWCVVAPRLRAVSIQRNYVSPVDFVYDRYRSTLLRQITVVCQVAPTAASLVGQFTAMKALIESISGGAVNGNVGNCVLATIILVYESFGGLESVAVTDVVQGAILLFGFISLPWMLFGHNGSFAARMQEVKDSVKPEFFTAPTTLQTVGLWGFAFQNLASPLYPFAIQRIYAARDNRSLRFSLRAVACAPFIFTIPGILVGLYALSHPAIEDKNYVFADSMKLLAAESAPVRAIVVAMLVGALAAIMSTADSCLIGVANIVSMDIVKASFWRSATPSQLVKVGKVTSILMCAAGIFVASLNVNLAFLQAFQGGLLTQIAPAFVLGLYADSFGTSAVLAGMAGGTCAQWGAAFAKIFGKVDIKIDPGLYGLGVNVALIVIVQLFVGSGGAKAGADSGSRLAALAAPLTTSGSGDGDEFARFGEERLSLAAIRESVRGVTEPVSSKLVLALWFVLFNVFVPFWWTPGAEVSLIGGWPAWAFYTLCILLIIAASNFNALRVWSEDEAAAARAHLDDAAVKRRSVYAARDGDVGGIEGAVDGELRLRRTSVAAADRELQL